MEKEEEGDMHQTSQARKNPLWKAKGANGAAEPETLPPTKTSHLRVS